MVAGHFQETKGLPDNTGENIAELSPYTDYTRREWEYHFKRLCYGVFKYRAESKGRVCFPGCGSPYGEKYDSFATMARVIPLLSCWLHNPENPQVIEFEGLEMDLKQFVADAFLSGTDEKSSDYWGEMYDRVSKLVEVNDLIWSLWLTKDTVFHKFSKAGKDRIIDWVSKVYDKVIWENNWQFTPVLVHLIKKTLGYDDHYDIEGHMASIEKMYRGDGWYSDTVDGEAYDYYNAWQIHFSTLAICCTSNSGLEAAVRERYIVRAKEFLAGFPYFFGANGSYVPFGRSLAYRFAVLGTMMLAGYMGVSPLEPGLERRIASGNLKFFMENGSVTGEHFLACGFLGEPKEKYELYMFYGSPYWCSRGFLCLMLPCSHPFWTAPELPLPVEKGDFTYRIPVTGFTLIGDRGTGSVQLLNAKNFSTLLKRSEPFYSKFSYSTHMFHSYVMHRGSFPADSILYCSSESGDYHRVVKIVKGTGGENYVYRVMTQGPAKGREAAEIKSFIIQLGLYQVRIHEIIPMGEGVYVEEGSYPIRRKGEGFTFSLEAGGWGYATNGRQTVYIQNALNYDRVKLYEDWQGRVDINLIPEETAFFGIGTKKPAVGRFFCGCISAGIPACLDLEYLRGMVPQILLDESGRGFLLKDCTGRESEYHFT